MDSNTTHVIGSLHFYSGQSRQMCVEEKRLENENCWALKGGKIQSFPCKEYKDEFKAICEHPVLLPGQEKIGRMREAMKS